MPSDRVDTAQSSELACLPQEPQSRNEAQDLLRWHWKTPCLIATNRIPCRRNQRASRAIRTACCCPKSLRIRVEARANVTEREVISRQLQLMQASVQHYLTEDLNTTDTSCPSRTSAEHFDDRPCEKRKPQVHLSCTQINAFIKKTLRQTQTPTVFAAPQLLILPHKIK